MGKEEFFRSRIKNNKFDQRIIYISKNKKGIEFFFIQASPSEKIEFKNS